MMAKLREACDNLIIAEALTAALADLAHVAPPELANRLEVLAVHAQSATTSARELVEQAIPEIIRRLAPEGIKAA